MPPVPKQDHCKPCYLPDLKLAEASGLMAPGSWTIADNVIYPGAPDLLAYLGVPQPGEEAADASPNGSPAESAVNRGDSTSAADSNSLRYEAIAVPARYEYDQVRGL